MVRSAAAILALFIFTGAAEAQQRHTVVDGETLWGLAQRYYNDPWRWPRIYEANRAPSGQVEDAHWIYPGEVIIIPDVEATPVVAGVVIEPVPAPVQPGPAPVITVETVEPERTVFYNSGGAQGGFVLSGTQNTRLAVPREVAVSAPWLGPESGPPPHIGTVTEFSGADDELVSRTIAMPFDRIQIALPGLAAARGTELLAFRISGEVPGVGQVLQPTGVLAVSDPTPEGAIALVVTVFEHLSVGDFLQPLPTYALRPGVLAQPVTTGADATIIGFAREHAINSLHDVAFLDQGSDQGVSIGEGLGGPPEIEGRLQVIQVHPDHASARIIWLRNPVFQTGGIVGLDRRMP
jgi:hypothetical protein